MDDMRRQTTSLHSTPPSSAPETFLPHIRLFPRFLRHTKQGKQDAEKEDGEGKSTTNKTITSQQLLLPFLIEAIIRDNTDSDYPSTGFPSQNPIQASTHAASLCSRRIFSRSARRLRGDGHWIRGSHVGDRTVTMLPVMQPLFAQSMRRRRR